ncbi:MAG: undecaprenyl-diphosphate phosphatase [Gammaproteobacteria bacterium]
MLDIVQIIILGLIQGLTEFLPISSSAHLILVPVILGWKDQGLAFDVAVHIGSLIAVVMYFRKDIKNMIADWFSSIFNRSTVGDSRLAWAVLFGTIPAGIAGLLLNDFVETQLRSEIVIAYATIGFGLLLMLGDWYGNRKGHQSHDEKNITWKDVVVISLFQVLALIPGTSRSGITMTAGLFMGLSRTASARFSFLLAIPIILAAGGFKTKTLLDSALPVDWNAILIGVIVSATSALFCIHFFLKLLDRFGMLPYVVYRLVLGGVLLMFFA